MEQYYREVAEEERAESERQRRAELAAASQHQPISDDDLSSFVIVDEDPFDVFEMRLFAELAYCLSVYLSIYMSISPAR